jgi:hypothetical protein
MEMGDWANYKSLRPYLDMSQPKDLQDGLARAGVLQKEVSAPPRRDDFERLYQELREIKRMVATNEVTNIEGVTEDLLKEVIENHSPQEESDSDTEEESSSTQVSISRSIKRAQNRTSAQLPVLGVLAGISLLLSDRLHREWTEFTNGGADWAPPRKMAKGGVVCGLFLGLIAAQMATSGVQLDPATLTWHASATDTLAILLGSALGIGNVLFSDYKHRIQSPA